MRPEFKLYIREAAQKNWEKKDGSYPDWQIFTSEEAAKRECRPGDIIWQIESTAMVCLGQMTVVFR